MSDKSSACRIFREAKKTFTRLSTETKTLLADADARENVQVCQQNLTKAYSELLKAAESYQRYLVSDEDSQEAERVTSFMTESEGVHKELDDRLSNRLKSYPLGSPPRLCYNLLVKLLGLLRLTTSLRC